MSSTPRPAKRRGFTLTEMLVVIGIIVLVLSIATPMIARAWRAGDRARMAADIQAIASALESYRQDFGDYPQVSKPWAAGPDDYNGARMLCRALIGPGPGESTDVAMVADGAGGRPATAQPTDPETLPAPGFRTRDKRNGRVYGPYLPVERFKTGDPANPGSLTTKPGTWAILDKYNRPILYYPATGKPNIRLAKSYAWDRAAADKPMYNARDNWNGSMGGMSTATLARMLGDFNANGMIDSTTSPPEQPAYEGPFLLWSAGPDETFGTPQGMPLGNPEQVRRAVERSDDITNFRN